jgi:hypothetical protein
MCLHHCHENSNVPSFITDLDPPNMEAVLATAPRTHALALKNCLYRYLTGKAAIEVTIPVS